MTTTPLRRSAAAAVALTTLLSGAVAFFGTGPGTAAGARRARPAGPVPFLSRWEDNLRGKGRSPSGPGAGPKFYASTYRPTAPLGFIGGDNHYDPVRVFYEGGDYARSRRAAGDLSWDPAPFDAAVRAAVLQYRDLYLLRNACRTPGYYSYNAGLARHYAETGDPASRDAALLLSEQAAYSQDGLPPEYGRGFEASREVAFAILLHLSAEDLGHPHRAQTDRLAALALGHVDQWTADPRPPCLFVRPFMVGLTLEALIAYWDRYRDPAVPPRVRRALGWLSAHAWDPSHGGNPGTGTFVYTDVDVNRLDPKACPGGFSADPGDQRVPAPDLGLLIAPAYAWFYQYSGEPAYRDWGDAAWAGSSAASTVFNQKIYNQSFRWSGKFLEWRERGDAPWPAARSLTLKAPDPASGRAGAPGRPFVVAFAGDRRSSPGPVAVTPSDGGAGGTFFPTEVRLTTDTPSAVFRYRPAAGASGAVKVSVSGGGGLDDPPPVTYTVRGRAPEATGYAVTGPRSVVAGRPAELTVSLVPEGAAPPVASDARGGVLVVELVDPAGRGAFVPYTDAHAGRAWLSADRPSMTVAYTPAAAGPATVRATNDGGLADPPALSLTAEAAGR